MECFVCQEAKRAARSCRGNFGRTTSLLKRIPSFHRYASFCSPFLPLALSHDLVLVREVNATMMDLTASQRQGEGVAHALDVVKAYHMGDYCTFFRLYKNAPNMTP